MISVGVTGGIGSGKTTVCKIWQQYGAYVLNADDLAKNLMVNDPDIRQEIIKTFGTLSYHEDGSLNRQHLGKEAFEKDRVKELNAIVHPHIPGKVEERMESAEKKGYEVFVFEAALLLQNLRPKNLDYIVMVLAGQENRIRRVQERDQVDKHVVLDRMQKQQNFEELVHLADFVIRNDGSLNNLKKRANEVYQAIVNSG